MKKKIILSALAAVLSVGMVFSASTTAFADYEYTVKPGDNLWKIAKTYLKNGSEYRKIYEANKSVIKDANSLSVGWKLIIPDAREDANGAEADLITDTGADAGEIQLNSKDYMVSWDESADAMAALEDYVKDVTDVKSPNFVPLGDRIAVSDMDGTLYGEKAPIYVEWCMYAYRVLEDPVYADKATDEQIEVANMIREAVKTGSIPEDLERRHAICNAQVFAGMTIAEYTEYVKNFVKREASGFENVTYADMWYVPMIEVVDYLNDNGFTVYICSGTDRYMCRALAEGKIDILPQHVIGMDVFVEASGQNGKDGLEYEYTDVDKVVRTDELIIKNVKANKVSQIQQEIGKKPILSFGNSSGDISMARFVVENNPYKSAAFMVVADDPIRENGSIEKGEAISKMWLDCGFIPISMREDWKTIYGNKVRKK